MAFFSACDFSLLIRYDLDSQRNASIHKVAQVKRKVAPIYFPKSFEKSDKCNFCSQSFGKIKRMPEAIQIDPINFVGTFANSIILVIQSTIFLYIGPEMSCTHNLGEMRTAPFSVCSILVLMGYGSFSYVVRFRSSFCPTKGASHA